MTGTTGFGRTPGHPPAEARQERLRRPMTGAPAAAVLATVAAFVVAPSHAAEVTVQQKDRAFVPTAVTIRAGDTLVFTNGDPFVHNMFSNTAGAEFNLGGQSPGEAKSVVLRRPGVVEVECQIHPRMHLRVEVK